MNESANPQLPGNQSGFISALFDFSFSNFVTTRIVKVLYIVAVVLVGLFSLLWAFSGFSHSFIAGLATLVLAPVVFFVWIAFARIYMEVVIIMFRIAEYLRSIDEKTN